MFKVVEKGLSREEFINKKQDIESNFEGKTYWGQRDNERVVDGVRCAICYAEDGETAKLWYTEKHCIGGDTTYDIYE